ncbi:FAD-binding oxidoreductase [Novosphingobium umbonatum]|uniref:FAD-binding oxidoreductase n=1 Tax=Novosphingobium umbonatum TaxID=1908524 RepID=A0A437N3C8_9SPHN|nr:FAD-binding oxidoreductase [Novosphingobium umbonatum]RVU04421.1 FAD-binding oxidoreductase [Novosphingobium umbonatum]
MTDKHLQAQTDTTASSMAFLEKAAALLGPRGLTQDGDVMAGWLSDWRGRYHGAALALASPADAQELSALVKLCVEYRVPIVPQGGNSGMSGGATPDASGRSLLVSLRRMNQIGAIDLENRRVTCGAGVVLQNLHEAAEAQGLRFPLTLGGKGSATVGGLISTNAGGTQVLRHGNMVAQVLGLEAVLPDGQIFSALTPLKKDNRGFDLKQLFIGSEGTLGMVTAATLKLIPALAERRVVWAAVESIQAARRLLLHVQGAMGEALEGFEVIPHPSLEAVFDYAPDTRNPLDSAAPWYTLIELVADQAQAESLGERVEAMLGEAFEQGLLSDAAIAANETQAEAFWGIRETVPMAERAKGPAKQHDIAVPVEKMPDFIVAASDTMTKAFPGCHAVAFGHLGDGNVHFHVIAPEGSDRAAWEAGDGKAISEMVHDLVTQWGGSISAEHGIGQLKVDDLARLADPARLHLLRSVKQALDPLGLLNPGKLIP